MTDKDLAPLMQFYNEGRKTGTFESGIQNAMVAMLSSAKFLYRMEPPPADAKPGSIYRLNGISNLRRAFRSSCGAASPTRNCSPRRSKAS